MNNNISLIQNQQLLNEKNKKLKPNSNSLKIENLINTLDKLIIDFNTDLETYNNYRIIIQDKINEFRQKNNNSRNVYVGKLPTIDHTFLGCYNNSNSMSYIGDNMSFENCKTSAIDNKSTYFSLNRVDGIDKCYISNNLNDIVNDGISYSKKSIWKEDIKFRNLDGRYQPGDIKRYRDINSGGFALSNDVSNYYECKSLCNSQPECSDTNNICEDKYYKNDNTCYCGYMSSGLQLRVLNTTFVIVDPNNNIFFTNDITNANLELKGDIPKEGFSTIYNGIQETFNCNKNNEEEIIIEGFSRYLKDNREIERKKILEARRKRDELIAKNSLDNKRYNNRMLQYQQQLENLQGYHYDAYHLRRWRRRRSRGSIIRSNIHVKNYDIWFNWRRNRVMGLKRDRIWLEFTGFIKIPRNKNNLYFRTLSDDGVRMWFNNKMIINHWSDHGPRYRNSPPIDVKAGEYYPFKIVWYENGGGAVVGLNWTMFDRWSRVNKDYFFTNKPSNIIKPEAPKPPNLEDIPLIKPPIENPNSNKKAKLEITLEGKLRLIDLNTNKELWASNSDPDSKNAFIIHDFNPTRDPTNKYKRSYLQTGEFLDIGESISSQNSKYKLNFTNKSIEIIKGNRECKNSEGNSYKLGDNNVTALYSLNEINYNYKINKNIRLSDEVNNNMIIGSSLENSIGKCAVVCDNNPECNHFVYTQQKNKIGGGSCHILKNLPEITELDKNSSINRTIGDKYTSSIFDDANKYMGKSGYIDENNNLHPYPQSMIKYGEDYQEFDNTKSEGNVIQEIQGDFLKGIERCNEIKNCAGFVWNKKNNSVSLKDNSIYPSSIKNYDTNSSLYLRNIVLNDSHNSCPKTIESITPDLWSNYELLNKITTPMNKSKKCGVINYIDEDLKELNKLFNKLNTYNSKVEKTIKELNNLNVVVKSDVLSIQSKLQESMTFLADTNKNMEELGKEYLREGFRNSIVCADEIINKDKKDYLSYTITGLLAIGLILFINN